MTDATSRTPKLTNTIRKIHCHRVVALVSGLFVFIAPFAIHRPSVFFALIAFSAGVVASCFFAIYRHSGRTFAHVSEKVSAIGPSLAYLNPMIIFGILFIWGSYSLHHGIPTFPSSEFIQSRSVNASTISARSPHESAMRKFSFRTAIASAKPSPISILFGDFFTCSKYCPFPEFYSSQINLLHFVNKNAQCGGTGRIVLQDHVGDASTTLRQINLHAHA